MLHWACLCAASLLLALPQPALAERVLLGTGDWPPYTAQQAPAQGVMTEIVSAVFKEMGAEPVYRFLPWKRAERMALEGEVYAIFPYVLTAERQAQFDFSDEIMPSTFVLFHRKRSRLAGVRFQRLEDLAGFTIGGVRGYWYERPFAQAGLKVDYAGGDRQGIQKLFLGRVDFAAAGDLVGWSLIRSLYPDAVDEFDVLPQPLLKDGLRLMVSRQHPNAAALTKRFNSALARLRQQGRVREILARHGVKE